MATPDDAKAEMMQYIERYAPLEMVAAMKADPSLLNVTMLYNQLLPNWMSHKLEA